MRTTSTIYTLDGTRPNVVVDELVAANNIAVTPPDFYSYFQKHPYEIPDGIHPNKIGYESMANLWFIASTQ